MLVVAQPSNYFIHDCAGFVGSANVGQNQVNIVGQHIFIEVTILFGDDIFSNRVLFCALSLIPAAAAGPGRVTKRFFGFYWHV